MDRLIYTAMTGASHILTQQAAVSQNLANANTPGYRSAINSFRAVPLVGQGMPTRTFVVDSVAGYDFSQGAMQQTGNTLDVAVNGQGWIAVQMPDGSEGYTRNGNLQLSPEGVLQTRSGFPVLGNSGQITVPQNTEITIGADGTISTIPNGSTAAQITAIDRIKLVNPPESQMVHGDDGIFRTKSGTPSVADPNVTVVDGSLEDSNVNVVDGMVSMISLSRQFEMQMQLLKTSSSNAQQASQILSVT